MDDKDIKCESIQPTRKWKYSTYQKVKVFNLPESESIQPTRKWKNSKPKLECSEKFKSVTGQKYIQTVLRTGWIGWNGRSLISLLSTQSHHIALGKTQFWEHFHIFFACFDLNGKSLFIYLPIFECMDERSSWISAWSQALEGHKFWQQHLSSPLWTDEATTIIYIATHIPLFPNFDGLVLIATLTLQRP